MRIFVYEFITGGGAWSLDDRCALSGSLAREGRAMASAIAADFASLPDVEVLTTRDSRLAPLHPANCRVELIESAAGEREALEHLAKAADGVLLIAPESDGILAARARWVASAGGKLISPEPEVIDIAGNKQITAGRLQAAGVPVPRGSVLEPRGSAPADLFPAVVKPLDGCGSVGVRKVATQADLEQFACDAPLRLEAFVPGLAVSVAVLCGPQGHLPMPACQQLLSSDGRFTYLGGRTPLPTRLDERARRLAISAVQALPSPHGYLGVDLVLGDDPSGADDAVIEVNPRLTTSYVGLRTLCKENLAAAMLAVLRGERPALSWQTGALQFTADGEIRFVNPIADATP
jgi:predicted ATP-grasp superfamily ATP-dependent carboligase